MENEATHTHAGEEENETILKNLKIKKKKVVHDDHKPPSSFFLYYRRFIYTLFPTVPKFRLYVPAKAPLGGLSNFFFLRGAKPDACVVKEGSERLSSTGFSV